jgi:hypothetical protein
VPKIAAITRTSILTAALCITAAMIAAAPASAQKRYIPNDRQSPRAQPPNRGRVPDHRPHPQQHPDDHDHNAHPNKQLRPDPAYRDRLPECWRAVPQRGLESAANAARRDAFFQLQRRILALRFSPSSRVADVARDDPHFADALARPFPGLVIEEPAYLPDTVCAIRLVIPVRSVIDYLKDLGRRYGTGPFRPSAFDGIRSFAESDPIVLVGRGAPGLDDLHHPDLKRPVWISETRVVKGRGSQPRSHYGTAAGKLFALRRAKDDARRQLIDAVRQLPIAFPEANTIGAHCDRRPGLHRDFNAWIENVEVIDTAWSDHGDCVVVMKADLIGLWDLINPPAYRSLNPDPFDRLPQDRRPHDRPQRTTRPTLERR